MSGCYWKLGQTKNVFSVDCKIRATGRKIFFVVIFTSNHFRRCVKRERRTHRRANRERERERERSRCRTHDHVGQIAILVPSMRRWVLCSSHSGKRRPIPLCRPILHCHQPSEQPTPEPIGPPWATHPWAGLVNDPFHRPIPHRHIAPFVLISLSLKSLSHDWSWDFDFFCFDFCFFDCLYILILCNNICLDPKKMWKTW